MPFRWRRACAWVTVVGLVLLASCGGGSSSAPPPIATVTSTPLPPPPTNTQEPAATLDATVEAPQVAAEPKCPDPYPDGAPYEPEEDEPIRLVPTGSPPELSRYTARAPLRDRELERIVERELGDEAEHFAVLVKNRADGKGVAVDANRRFYAASLFKTWVMVEAVHQREAGLLDWDERYIVSDHYAALGLNAGELELCSEVSVRVAVERMMRATDNVAANMLLDRAGAGNINAALRALGLTVSGFFQDDSLPTTAADMALLLEAIVRNGAVSEGASQEMVALLASESIDDRLPALLPAETVVAHKTGNWSNATHDVGIVFSPQATYVIVVLTDYGYEDGGAARIARLSRAVYDYYNAR